MLKIYGVPMSVHTRKVIVAAIEKGLAYENVPVIPFTPPDGWDRLSPTGKIPVMTDGAVTLADSSVICTYLERTYPERPIYPAATRDYLQALWLEEYADGTVFRDVVHGLFFQKVIRPKLLQQPTDNAAVAAILDKALPKVFGYLESVLTGVHAAGERFGIADIAIVSNLVNFQYLGLRLDGATYPRLAAYFARQSRHPAMAKALAAEQAAAASMGLERGFLGEVIAAAA
jgi:glutathione S-transferase